MWKQLMTGAALPIAAAGLYMWKEAFRNEVKETVVTDDRFPEKAPLALFFISDIHRRRVHPSIISAVKGRADAVIIGGDLCEGGVKRERIRENIKRLSSIAPVYFVPGNNDYEAGIEQLTAMLARWQVTVLKNSWAVLADDVYLLGTDDLSEGKSDKAALFHNVPVSAFKIIASHNPAFVRIIEPEDQVAVLLSGHTHGGQVRLGPWGMYEKGGWKNAGGIHMLVSNGYGTTGLPLRLGARAETHLITICRPGQTT